jgi:hypothetical protein
MLSLVGYTHVHHLVCNKNRLSSMQIDQRPWLKAACVRRIWIIVLWAVRAAGLLRDSPRNPRLTHYPPALHEGSIRLVLQANRSFTFTTEILMPKTSYLQRNTRAETSMLQPVCVLVKLSHYALSMRTRLLRGDQAHDRSLPLPSWTWLGMNRGTKGVL